MTIRPARRPRPGLAIVSTHLTPYRVHLHRRLAAEIPEVDLHSIFVGTRSELNWSIDVPPEIRPVFWDAGGERPWSLDFATGARLAGQVLDHVESVGARVLVVNGHARPSLLSLIHRGGRRGLRVFLRADSNAAGEASRGRLRGLAKRAFLAHVLVRCDGVLAMGSGGTRYFDEHGAAPSRTFQVPYEPDYGAIRAITDEDARAFRARHALREGRRALLFVGRLVPVKGVDVLIRAFQRVAPARPDWDLWIAGTGAAGEALRAGVARGMTERVRWLGFLDQDQVLRAHRAADVFVLPSRREPWGVVVNEAVAAGSVVVASAVVGAAMELVRDGISGRLVRPDSVAALSAALEDVTRTERLRELAAAVPGVLDDWRRRADPVAGMRAALRSVGLP